jgi:nucleoside-diphosphate-sugar epimerase
MKITILGGCGYIGTTLTEKLLKQGFKVTVIDNMWFGNFLKKNKNLKTIQSDIRDLNRFSFKGSDAIIHLANIANDESVDLNPSLSWDVNVIASQNLINKAINERVPHFIFSSSGSVYGVKKEKKVTEDLPPTPISTYNKTKIIAERVLLSYQNKIKVHCIRPATVCGFSPRMRLDLTVNLLTFQALTNSKIIVYGGKQVRPNIHIQDLVNVFLLFLKKDIKSGFFNAGFENYSIIQIAKKIQSKIPCKIIIKKIKDIRSYRLDSSKLLRLGFKKKYDINLAIKEIKDCFLKNQIKNDPRNYTISWLKKIKIT